MHIMGFDLVKGMMHEMPLTMLVLIDCNLRLYLAALLMMALYKSRHGICISKKKNVIELKEELENFLRSKTAKLYGNYSKLVRNYHLHELPKELVG